ncbi:uncharacterized protein LOC135213628 [Macrobrachium nipponense]|uniref:uncharacterized protein LOC135213628 n=1 Tax=Macrobrachium nipponense TaxID=159736 RepID=UPI0030C8D229
MKGGALAIRILAILLHFGALNADNSTQYEGCHKNLTSSTGSVSEQEFSGLNCPEHGIRIQAGVPIVLTCQDLVLEVASQQYCVSIGGIKKGKPRTYKLGDNGDDPNNGGKRKPERNPHTRGRRAKALGKEQKAQRLTTEADLKSSDHQNMAQQKPSNRRRENNKNKNKLKKLTSRLEKHTTKIGKLEDKITKLQNNPNAENQVSQLKKKLDGLKAKSEVLQSKIDELQSLLGTSSGLINGTSGMGTTVNIISVIIDNQSGSDSHQTGNVNGDDSIAGDNGSDDIYYGSNSHDGSGYDSQEMGSGVYGGDSHENGGDYNYYNNWPSMGIWAKPKPKVLEKGSTKNLRRKGKGEGKGNGKAQSFCGAQDQPITVKSQTGEIGLSVRPKGLKEGNGSKPSKPHHGRRGNGSHGGVAQGPAGAAAVMIPSEVKYTCSWSPSSP